MRGFPVVPKQADALLAGHERPAAGDSSAAVLPLNPSPSRRGVKDRRSDWRPPEGVANERAPHLSAQAVAGHSWTRFPGSRYGPLHTAVSLILLSSPSSSVLRKSIASSALARRDCRPSRPRLQSVLLRGNRRLQLIDSHDIHKRSGGSPRYASSGRAACCSRVSSGLDVLPGVRTKGAVYQNDYGVSA